MAFRQQVRPQSARQIAQQAPEPASEVAASSQQPKRPLEASEEWILFSPTAPSTTARTQTTSTERTPRTAGLSRFSEFGSLDTAAHSDQDGDVGTFLGTEEELDSLDDGLHAFHEPSEYGAPASRLLQSGETVLPTHDGLGEFQPDATMQEHMWQFERPRRRAVRRRSSVQRHFTTLDDTEEVNQEQDRRQRIEKWRLDQSRALLEEIEKETRRIRRMSTFTASRSRLADTQPAATSTGPRAPQSAMDAQSNSSEEGTEDMSFWQRITRRVIRDLIGLDEDTLSVIFGEALPEESATLKSASPIDFSADKALQDAGIVAPTPSEESWQTRILERVAQELGVLVHQLSEHPGAFSTYQRTQSTPEYAGLPTPNPTQYPTTDVPSSHPAVSQQPPADSPADSPASAHFAPTFPTTQPSHTYNEAALWGIEEEPTSALPPTSTTNIADDLVREREYWERELDVKMIFNFLVKRFTSHRTATSTPRTTPSIPATDDSARRAAIIRHNHPLVSQTTGPTSSVAQQGKTTYRTYYNPQPASLRGKLRSSESCASQSTKKSKRSGSSARNYWDFGGSGSGSVFAGEV
jgi:hypothetical protein